LPSKPSSCHITDPSRRLFLSSLYRYSLSLSVEERRLLENDSSSVLNTFWSCFLASSFRVRCCLLAFLLVVAFVPSWCLSCCWSNVARRQYSIQYTVYRFKFVHTGICFDVNSSTVVFASMSIPFAVLYRVQYCTDSDLSTWNSLRCQFLFTVLHCTISCTVLYRFRFVPDGICFDVNSSPPDGICFDVNSFYCSRYCALHCLLYGHGSQVKIMYCLPLRSRFARENHVLFTIHCTVKVRT